METECTYCHNESQHGFRFCPHCGSPKVIAPVNKESLAKILRPYRRLLWLWKVSTESSDKGMELLGIYEGAVHEIAFRLAHKAYNTLHFEAMDPEAYRLSIPTVPPRFVHVQFADASGLYTEPFYNNEIRLAALREMFKEDPVRIEPSQFPKAFIIRFKDEPKE